MIAAGVRYGAAAATLGLLLFSWFLRARAPQEHFQGYVEGEFVYIASPLAGALQKLAVQRGDQVKPGDLLFQLDNIAEKAARDEADRRLAQGIANLEDAKKGKRPSEIESIESQLRQAQAALAFSERDLIREQELRGRGASTPQNLERARSTRDQDRQRVAQLTADLQTARLPARIDQIVAAEANVRALRNALARAEWDLSQKQQSAPQGGLVFDTLYRQGEWVAAGKPVVVLLPPHNIKVRVFIPERRVGSFRVGQEASIFVDGVAEAYPGKITYISPQVEFSPPVIYSRESRSKLVFMIELRFKPTVAVQLHPGQPVDVRFGP